MCFVLVNSSDLDDGSVAPAATLVNAARVWTPAKKLAVTAARSLRRDAFTSEKSRRKLATRSCKRRLPTALAVFVAMNVMWWVWTRAIQPLASRRQPVATLLAKRSH